MDSSDSDSDSTSKEIVEVEEEAVPATVAKEPDPEDSLDSSEESVSAVREPSAGKGHKRARGRSVPAEGHRERSPAGEKRRSPSRDKRRPPAGDRRRSPAGQRRRSPEGRVRRSPAGERARSPVREKRPASPERPPSKGKSKGKGKDKDGRYVRCPHCWQHVVNTQCSRDQHQYWSQFCNTWQRYNRGATWADAVARAERALQRRQGRTQHRAPKEETERTAPKGKSEKERVTVKKEKKKDKEKRKRNKRVSPSPDPRKPLGDKRRRPPSSDDEPGPKERRSSASKGWTKVWHWVKL